MVLLNAGPDVNQARLDGHTPLSLVRIRGPTLNPTPHTLHPKPFTRGMTAELKRIEPDRLYTTQVGALLDAGADWNASDYSGRTALEIACERGNAEAVKLLLRASKEAGSPGFLRRRYRRNLQNRCMPGLRCHSTAGHTPLMSASRYGHQHVVRCLPVTGKKFPQP